MQEGFGFIFLGLEAWKQPGKIFLKKGKYVVEILKRFKMMKCKSMSTLVTTNMKIMGASDS
jgi:hypothetical protein